MALRYVSLKDLNMCKRRKGETSPNGFNNYIRFIYIFNAW